MSAMKPSLTFVFCEISDFKQLLFALSSRSSHWMITEIGGDVKVQRVVSGE